MQIAIIALGSRGDIQPYIALAKGLQAGGIAVRLIANENYDQLVRSHGLDFWPVSGNVQEIAESPDMRRLLEKGDFLAVMRRAAQESERISLLWAKQALVACQSMDALVAGLGGLFVGLALAEKLNLTLVQAYNIPFTPTRAFPGALFPKAISRLGGAANLLSHHLTRQILWQQFRSSDRPARTQALGLPAAPFWGPYHAAALRGAPILYGFSPAVIARPVDWGNEIHVTGYWFLDAEPDWAPAPALVEFIESGPPPIYIGFGSMSSRKPEETTDLMWRALAETRQRAVILSGWNGLQAGRTPDHMAGQIFVADSIPHDWLFARMAAVVHHGGAGTTAAGLRAGVPSVVIPFFADQPFWGQRVADLGVGPQPIARRKLTVNCLAQAIHQAVTDRGMRQRAAALGAQIRAEDGIGTALAVLRGLGR